MAYDTSEPLSYYEKPEWRLQPTAPILLEARRMAMDKEENKRKWDHESKKRPSYKIDESASPFAIDHDEIAKNTDNAISAVYAGNDPIVHNQKNLHIQNKAKAQKIQLDEQRKQINDLQQTHGTAIDTTPVDQLHNESYQTPYHSRDEVLKKSGEEISNPVNIYNRNVAVRNQFGNDKIFPTQTIDYSNEAENGVTTTGNKGKVSGKLLIDDTSRPIMERDQKGNLIPKLANGRPLYEKRNIQSPQEAVPFAEQILSDPFHKKIALQQVAKEQGDVVNNESKVWSDKWKDETGEFPSKEAIEANRAGIINRLATEDTAKQLFQMEKGYNSGNPTMSQDEPRHVTQKDRDNKVLVSKPQLDQTRYGYHDKGLGKDDIQTIATTTFTKNDGTTYKFNVPDIRGKDEKGNFIPLNSAMGKAEIVDAHLVPLTGGDGSGVPSGYKNWSSYLKSNPHATHYVGGNIVLKVPRSKQELNDLGLSTEVINSARSVLNDPNASAAEKQEAQDKFLDLDSKATFKVTVPFDKIKSQIYSATGGQIKSISDIFGKELVDSKAKELSDAQKSPRKAASTSPTKVTTQAQYDALPKGTRYVDSKGNPAIKK